MGRWRAEVARAAQGGVTDADSYTGSDNCNGRPRRLLGTCSFHGRRTRGRGGLHARSPRTDPDPAGQRLHARERRRVRFGDRGRSLPVREPAAKGPEPRVRAEGRQLEREGHEVLQHRLRAIELDERPAQRRYAHLDREGPRGDDDLAGQSEFGSTARAPSFWTTRASTSSARTGSR